MPNKNEQSLGAVANVFQILSSFATLLGVVGIYFVYQQLKVSEEETILNSQAQVYSQMVEIDKIFMERPEVRLYLYNNLRPEDMYPFADESQLRVERAKAEAAAELMLDFFGQLMQVLHKLGPAESAWRAYIQDIYVCSPMLRQLYAQRAGWYSDLKSEPAIVDIIHKAEEQLKQGDIACGQIQLAKP